MMVANWGTTIMHHAPELCGEQRIAPAIAYGASAPQAAAPRERLLWVDCGPSVSGEQSAAMGRVGVWRGGCRPNISVAAPFVWRCLTGSTLAPFPHSAHRTGHADFPHPALGQDITPFRV